MVSAKEINHGRPSGNRGSSSFHVLPGLPIHDVAHRLARHRELPGQLGLAVLPGRVQVSDFPHRIGSQDMERGHSALTVDPMGLVVAALAETLGLVWAV